MTQRDDDAGLCPCCGGKMMVIDYPDDYSEVRCASNVGCNMFPVTYQNPREMKALRTLQSHRTMAIAGEELRDRFCGGTVSYYSVRYQDVEKYDATRRQCGRGE